MTQHEITRHNTTQHDTTWVQNNTTRIQHKPTEVYTKEALAAKIGLYFALFVTELYIFL